MSQCLVMQSLNTHLVAEEDKNALVAAVFDRQQELVEVLIKAFDSPSKKSNIVDLIFETYEDAICDFVICQNWAGWPNSILTFTIGLR